MSALCHVQVDPLGGQLARDGFDHMLWNISKYITLFFIFIFIFFSAMFYLDLDWVWLNAGTICYHTKQQLTSHGAKQEL